MTTYFYQALNKLLNKKITRREITKGRLYLHKFVSYQRYIANNFVNKYFDHIHGIIFMVSYSNSSLFVEFN